MSQKVSIVVLTWHSRQFLPDCIASVGKQTYPALELIVMDNASRDGSAAWLREHHPLVKVIRNPTNLGFAGAHNLGIRQTQGAYYLPLNPDVRLAPEYVEKLVTALEADAWCGMAQGKLLQASVSTTAPAFDSTGIVITKTRRNRDRAFGELDHGQHDEPEFIFGAAGAAPLYRRRMLEDIRFDDEYFDEVFFAYREEVDLAWRAQWRGWRCRYVPSAVAYHARRYSPDTRRDQPARLRQLQYRNRYLMLIKNASLQNLLLHAPYVAASELLALAYVLVAERQLLPCYCEVAGLLRAMLRKRKRIMSTRRVSALQMRRWFK
jgi:GT2 family glycosyltransferase